MATTDIAIIGSGLSGLALALALKKQNITSTIYESRPETFTAGGDIGLAPNALRVLDHLGVYQSVRPLGFNFSVIHLLNCSGGYLGDLQQGEIYGYPGLRLPRKSVRDELLKEVDRKGINVIYDKRLKNVEEKETEGRVKLSFEDGETIEANFVIGADGLRSTVRKSLDIGSEPMFSGTMVLYGTAPKKAVDAKMGKNDQRLENPSLMFGREGSFTVWPRDYEGEELGYFANIVLPDRTQEEWKELRENKAGLRKILTDKFCQGTWPEQVRIMCEETPDDEFKIWPVYIVPSLSSWKSPSGKVILIGDAAHAIPPSAGQGGAVAFEDAEALAYAFSVLKKKPEALSTWETIRKDRVKEVIAFTNLMAKIRQPSQNVVIQMFREWFIWAVFKFKGTEGSRWLYGYDSQLTISSKL